MFRYYKPTLTNGDVDNLQNFSMTFGVGGAYGDFASLDDLMDTNAEISASAPGFSFTLYLVVSPVNTSTGIPRYDTQWTKTYMYKCNRLLSDYANKLVVFAPEDDLIGEEEQARFSLSNGTYTGTISFGVIPDIDKQEDFHQGGNNDPYPNENLKIIDAVLCIYDDTYVAEFRNNGIVYTNRKAVYQLGASLDAYDMMDYKLGEWNHVAPMISIKPVVLGAYDAEEEEYASVRDAGDNDHYEVDLVSNITGDKYGIIGVPLDGNVFLLSHDNSSEVRTYGFQMMLDFGLPTNEDDIIAKTNHLEFIDMVDVKFDIPNSGESTDWIYDQAKSTLYLTVDEDTFSKVQQPKGYFIPITIADSYKITQVHKAFDSDYTFIGDTNQNAPSHINVDSISYDPAIGTFYVEAAREGEAYIRVFMTDNEDEPTGNEYLKIIRVKVIKRPVLYSTFNLSFVEDAVDGNSDYSLWSCDITKTQYDNLMKAVKYQNPTLIDISQTQGYLYDFDALDENCYDAESIGGAPPCYPYTDIPNDIYDLSVLPDNIGYNSLPFDHGYVLYDWQRINSLQLEDTTLNTDPKHHTYIYFINDNGSYKIRAKIYQDDTPMNYGTHTMRIFYPYYVGYCNDLSRLTYEGNSFDMECVGQYMNSDTQQTDYIFKCTCDGYISSNEYYESGNTEIVMQSWTNQNKFVDIILKSTDFSKYDDLSPDMFDDDYGNPLEYNFNIVSDDDFDGNDDPTYRAIFFLTLSADSIDGTPSIYDVVTTDNFNDSSIDVSYEDQSATSYVPFGYDNDTFNNSNEYVYLCISGDYDGAKFVISYKSLPLIVIGDSRGINDGRMWVDDSSLEESEIPE